MDQYVGELSPYPWHWAPEEQIAYYAHAYGSLVTSCHFKEVLFGEQNEFRMTHGYYQDARLVAKVTDDEFARAFPDEYGQLAAQLEPEEERWETAGKLHGVVDQSLYAAGITGYIGYHRAKSAFSTRCKCLRQDIDVDEVFDVYGIRLVAEDSGQAFAVISALQNSLQLMEQHAFRRRHGDIHQPVRGNLDSTNVRHYGSLRMNFIHEGRIFEVQVTTRDILRQQYDYVRESYASEHPGHKQIFLPAAFEVVDDYKGITGAKPDVCC